jgi:hypothetical protein
MNSPHPPPVSSSGVSGDCFEGPSRLQRYLPQRHAGGVELSYTIPIFLCRAAACVRVIPPPIATLSVACVFLLRSPTQIAQAVIRRIVIKVSRLAARRARTYKRLQDQPVYRTLCAAVLLTKCYPKMPRIRRLCCKWTLNCANAMHAFGAVTICRIHRSRFVYKVGREPSDWQTPHGLGTIGIRHARPTFQVECVQRPALVPTTTRASFHGQIHYTGVNALRQQPVTPIQGER